MTHRDVRGNPCSSAHAVAREAAERALWRLMSFYDTPLADEMYKIEQQYSRKLKGKGAGLRRADVEALRDKS